MNRFFFWKNIKNYKWRSIFLRHLVTSFFIMFIPLLIFGLLFATYYIHSTKHNLETEASYITSDISNTFSLTNKTIDQIYTSFITNKYTRAYMFSNDTTSTLFHTDEITETHSYITSYVNTTDELSSIYVYKLSNDYVLSSRSPAYLNDFFDKKWYDVYVANNKTDVEFSGYSRGSTKNPEYTIVKNINIDNIHCGVMVFNVNIIKLYNTVTAQNPNISNVFILDKNNRILINKNPDIIGTLFDDKLIDHSSSKTVYEQSRENYKIIAEIKNPVTNEINLFRIVLIIMTVILLPGIIVSSYYFSVHYYKDMLEILSILNENDDTNSETNEMEKIANNILAIKNKNIQMERQLENNIKALRKSQLYTLQQQINPHFIFNTLNLIVTIDRKNNKKLTETSKIIILLSEILRFNFRNPNYIISFEDELKYTKMYMELQNIRYSNKFDFVCNIPQNLLKSSVPKFMLQPLVENSIKHGILTKEIPEGIIEINSYTSSGLLYVTVSDTGCGISKERLKFLNNVLSSDSINNEFIGIINVHKRIKLIFGEQYGLSVNSTENGATVIIKLPYK